MKKIFLILNIGLVILGHVIVFFIWRHFFAIEGVLGQAIIAEMLLIALFIRVVASPLIYRNDNYFTRALYLSAFLWLGYMMNAVFVAILILLASYILSLFDIVFLFSSQQLIFSILPLIMIPFQGHNAGHHRIKKVDIEIENLPEEWEGKTIAHLTDIHLGPIYRQRFFTKIVRKTMKLKPDAICITGDLFDGMESDFSWLIDPYKELTAPRGVYYSFGNHDLSLGRDTVKDLLENSEVEILDNETKLLNGLQIVGVTCLFDRKMDFKQTILEQAHYDVNTPSVLLFHEPRYIKEAREVGIDLQLSGHTHRGQMFPGNILGHMLYKGYGYGVYRRKGYNLVVGAGTGTWGPPLRTFHRSEIVLITLKKK